MEQDQKKMGGGGKKLIWTKMQIGDLNISLIFRAMVSALKQECQSEVQHHNIQDYGSEVITDDILLLKILLAIILQYLRWSY